MSSFFTELLDNFPRPAFLEKVCGRYHYEKSRLDELKENALEMLPFLREEAFWESMAVERRDGVSGLRSIPVEQQDTVLRRGAGQEADEPLHERVVISLGTGLDRLQERYSGQGLLSKSYMLEALAGELLLESYGAYNRHVAEATDLHVARYHFPGSEAAYPLELLPELLAGLTDRVICNAAFCLLPKKSVVFVAELTRDEKVQCEGICLGCNRAHCTNRITDDFQTRRRMAGMADIPLNYGYSRIFGK